MQVGDRVRYSGYVTQRKRDYWNQCGHEPAKSRAKSDLDKCLAERGTVVELLNLGLRIRWDSGYESQCLSHIVTPAK